jgi:hypothetical protein
MDYHLDYGVKLSRDIEHDSLYKWCLREFDDNGKKVGSDQIPWDWNLYFDVTKLSCNFELTQEERDNFYFLDDEERMSENENEEPPKIGTGERIYGVMQPADNSFRNFTSYSMFGTNRQIEHFSFTIHQHDKDERCIIWGSPSYTSEIDFRDETQPDLIEITILVSPIKFEAIADLIKSNTVNEAELMLGGVTGFYSEWSPSISTHGVKVLARGKDQNLEIPEDCDIEPPRLGEVNEFSLRLNHILELNVKRDDGELEENDFEDDDDIYGSDDVVAKPVRAIENRTDIAALQKTLKRLTRPLWMIFFVLILIFIAMLN